MRNYSSSGHARQGIDIISAREVEGRFWHKRARAIKDLQEALDHQESLKEILSSMGLLRSRIIIKDRRVNKIFFPIE